MCVQLHYPQSKSVEKLLPVSNAKKIPYKVKDTSADWTFASIEHHLYVETLILGSNAAAKWNVLTGRNKLALEHLR